MARYKQTRPKERPGGGMSDQTETRVFESDNVPVLAPYPATLTTLPAHDWKDDKPNSSEKADDKKDGDN